MRLTIHVTQEDIDHNGEPPCDCPVARAIAREVPAKLVKVGWTVCNIGRQRVNLPEDVQTWIKQVTANPKDTELNPITFTLDVPDV